MSALFALLAPLLLGWNVMRIAGRERLEKLPRQLKGPRLHEQIALTRPAVKLTMTTAFTPRM
jgi:hypothetical protein